MNSTTSGPLFCSLKYLYSVQQPVQTVTYNHRNNLSFISKKSEKFQKSLFLAVFVHTRLPHVRSSTILSAPYGMHSSCKVEHLSKKDREKRIHFTIESALIPKRGVC